jgi:SAM-dependent methyltransferase
MIARDVMKTKTLGIIVGLTAAAAGLVWQRRRANRSPLPVNAWLPALSRIHDAEQTQRLLAETEARYRRLVAERPAPQQRALRRHLLNHILPGLALYQALLETHGGDRQAALAEIASAFRAETEARSRTMMRLLRAFPWPFAFFRLGFALQMTEFPKAGWDFAWIENSSRRIALDIRSCFYLQTLTALGAPELTASFCQTDDWMGEMLPPGITFRRTRTLGRGDDRCDFRFCRVGATGGGAESAADALAIYACPVCKGNLEPAANALRCPTCQAAYPVVDGILDFLREDREETLGPVSRALLKTVVRLYETPLWYAPILKLAGGPAAPSYAEIIRQMVGLMDVRQGLLLDVACGPGTWGRRRASPAMTVYGIDISWSMLRQGVRMAEDEHIEAIHFAHARVEALPFHDGQFDAAYCGGALHGFPDTVGALTEIGRTLKPGAPLVVLTFLNRDQPLVRLRRRAEARNDKLVKLHMFEVPELEGALAQAGFAGFEPWIYGGVIIFRARKAK